MIIVTFKELTLCTLDIYGGLFHVYVVVPADDNTKYMPVL